MKYTEAFDAAKAAISIMSERGMRFRRDAARNAALAVAGLVDRTAVVAVMTREIERHLVKSNRLWDGSIG